MVRVLLSSSKCLIFVRQSLNERTMNIERFLAAQQGTYAEALAEVKAGRKTSHWIWWIFPQLRGLGISETSHYYGISGLEEARAYWLHPVLKERLREITLAFLQTGKSAESVFGMLDAMKVRSCMTLFYEATKEDLFMQVLQTRFNGQKDNRTLEMLYLPKDRFLLGAVAGDVIGSVYEHYRTKRMDFPFFPEGSRFTDDTVMTVANAYWLLYGEDLARVMQRYGNRYPHAGYGGMFRKWLTEESPQPYRSFGNGSAMRVSPVGWAFDTLEETLEAASRSASVTHNHPEGIKGAQAVAACIFLARHNEAKQEIKAFVEQAFGYDLARTCDEIRPSYRFDSRCQGSVPESILAFLESTDYESAVRLAVSLGGDADTMGAIAGSIAEAYYGGVPEPIRQETLKRIPDEFTEVLKLFSERFVVN